MGAEKSIEEKARALYEFDAQQPLVKALTEVLGGGYVGWDQESKGAKRSYFEAVERGEYELEVADGYIVE